MHAYVKEKHRNFSCLINKKHIRNLTSIAFGTWFKIEKSFLKYDKWKKKSQAMVHFSQRWINDIEIYLEK